MPKPSSLPGNRSGFTMIELALALTVIAIMTAMMIPRLGRVMNSTRVNRTATIVASDLEQAFTLAGRFRKPMRITCDCPNSIYTIADRSDGTLRLTRRLQGCRPGQHDPGEGSPGWRCGRLSVGSFHRSAAIQNYRRQQYSRSDPLDGRA